MARRRSITFLFAGLVAASAALAMAGTAMAVPVNSPPVPSIVPGNDGTVKIHDGNGEDEPIVNNEPQVCTFHVHFFFADEGQSGDWWIQSWPPTGDMTTVLTGSYLSGPDGEYRTPADPDTYALEDGHYKLFWQGDEEELVKHKVFWVACEEPSPTPFESFQGETSQPSTTPCPGAAGPDILVDTIPSSCPSQTPFESFQGETSQPSNTPPSTSTEGGSPSGGSTPLFAFLISFIFGSAGFVGLALQRRGIAV